MEAVIMLVTDYQSMHANFYNGWRNARFPPLPSKRRVACVAFTCLTSVYAVIYLGVVIIRLHPQIGSE